MNKYSVIGWLMALADLAPSKQPLDPEDVPYLNEAIRLLEEGDGNV